MKKSNAQITISIYAECPHCESTIDLMEQQSLLDDGYIYSCLLSDDGFGKENWNEEFECPECNKLFIIEDVGY